MPEGTPPPNRDIWFRAKRFGWGWGLPCKWQGWVFLLAWIAAIVAGTAGLLTMLAVWPIGVWLAADLGFTLFMVAVLLAVCWCKGERPRWRWGD